MRKGRWCLLCFLLPIVTACGRYYADPCSTGLASCRPGVMWQPCLSYPFLLTPRTTGEEYTPCLPQEGQELDICQLIDIALSNNPRTQRSWHEARAASYELGMEQAACFPTVIATESLTYTDVSNRGSTRLSINPEDPSAIVNPTDVTQLTPGTEFQGYTKSWTNNLSLSFLVMDFGGRAADIDQARQALFASNWIHNRTLQDVLLDVLQSYYTYLDATAQRRAKNSDMEEARMNLAAAFDLYEAGVGRKVDVYQAQADFANAQLILAEAGGQQTIAGGNLARAVGVPVDTPLTVRPMPSELPIEPIQQSLEELMEVAKLQRPDLAAAYAGICAKRAEWRSVLSDALPIVNVNVNLQRTNYFNRPVLNGHTYSSSLSLNIPLFNGFLYMNQLRKMREELKAAKSDWLVQEQQAYVEVLTSYQDVETAIESVAFSERFLSFAEEAYALAFGTYKEGTGTILDVLSAQRSLANARAQQIRSRTQWALAVTQLGYATGTIGVRGC